MRVALAAVAEHRDLSREKADVARLDYFSHGFLSRWLTKRRSRAAVAGADRDGAAQTVRETVLKDLSTRRKKARQQIEQLNAGRERLLQAYDVVRNTVEEATTELSASVTDARPN